MPRNRLLIKASSSGNDGGRSKKSTIAPNYHANSLKYKHVCHSIFRRNHLNFPIRFRHLEPCRFFSNPRKLLSNPYIPRVSPNFEFDELCIFDDPKAVFSLFQLFHTLVFCYGDIFFHLNNQILCADAGNKLLLISTALEQTQQIPYL